jgi:hypothetical protein
MFKGLRRLCGEVERRNIRCAVILVSSPELSGDAAMTMSVLG